MQLEPPHKKSRAQETTEDDHDAPCIYRAATNVEQSSAVTSECNILDLSCIAKLHTG